MVVTGIVLGPQHFTAYINDFAEGTEGTAAEFDDGTTVGTKESCKEVIRRLQRDINCRSLRYKVIWVS